jgi:cellulose synthase (UDP-forming)
MILNLAWLQVALILLWAGILSRNLKAVQSIFFRRSAIAIITLLSFRYLLWRGFSTLNLSDYLSGALSLLLLTSEIILIGHGVLQLWLAWFRDPPVAEEADYAMTRLEKWIRGDPGHLPVVDVVVPSCGEPLELLERSLRGCMALEYPRFSVWLLDDTGRPELARLCLGLGCNYLRRTDKRYAKAGNLNHALPYLCGDLILVFDADVVPQRHFLARTVGLFEDPRVALVQTPQSYMNPDPVIRNLGLERWLMPDEEVFYRWIEPTRQGVGAVVCAGTSFVVRRTALEQVGGFETGTPSEDLATGIRLAAAGHRIIYLNEKLSAGLAPSSLEAMVRQRSRWASGTLQTLRTSANPLFIPGLTVLQRVAFLEGILHWFNVVPQLVLLMMPLSFGLLGARPLVFNHQGLLSAALPLLIAQIMLVRWFSHGSQSAFMPELYRWIFAIPVFLAVVGTVLGHPRPFLVTPKQTPVANAKPGSWLAKSFAILLCLHLVNLVILLSLSGSAFSVLSLIWSLMSIGILLAAIRACWDLFPSGGVLWFRPSDVYGVLTQGVRRWNVRFSAISERGVELSLLKPGQAEGQPEPHLLLQLYSQALGMPPLDLRLEQVRSSKSQLQVGAVWRFRNEDERILFQARLYQQPGVWPVRQAPSSLVALSVVFSRILCPPRPDGWFCRSALPIVLK